MLELSWNMGHVAKCSAFTQIRLQSSAGGGICRRRVRVIRDRQELSPPPPRIPLSPLLGLAKVSRVQGERKKGATDNALSRSRANAPMAPQRAPPQSDDDAMTYGAVNQDFLTV